MFRLPAWAIPTVASAVLLSSCIPFGLASTGIHLQNIDGPAVHVVTWRGGPSVTMDCGHNADLSDSGAPASWDLVIVEASSGKQLFLHQLSGSQPLYVIVRADGVLWGTEQGSGGPAPMQHCS